MAKKMSKNKIILPLLLLTFLCACDTLRKEDFPVPLRPQRVVYGNDQNIIVLQNLTSRVIATCKRTEDVSAETCAKLFESKGYVRIRDIPYKTADYDFLKTDTYPTRRWRGGEDTPRW